MNNPMMSKLQTGNLGQLKKVANLIKTAKNPQMMINQMLQNNPNYQRAVDYVNQNGGDAKEAFYALAKQNGLDPNEILGIFR